MNMNYEKPTIELIEFTVQESLMDDVGVGGSFNEGVEDW